MLDFCGKNIPECLKWWSALSGWEKFFITVGVLIALFIILRIVNYICSWWD